MSDSRLDWRRTRVAPEGTHHLWGEEPLYAQRFDEVLKFHEPGLAPVRRGNQAWHINVLGEPAYARTFLRTFGFYEGRAAVQADQRWHHIEPQGSDLYPERYAWCGNYQGGRCTVRDSQGLYLHLDLEGRAVYPERWRYAGDYRDGLAVVQREDGLSTHVDLHGALLHGRWFLDLDVFHKGFARARDERGWTHVDMAGRPVYGRRFAQVEPFYNGQARVERLDGGLEVIDEAGRTLVELRPALRSELAALSADLVGHWRTDAIAAAVRLGVFEALPGSEAHVAARCGLPVERLHRLLRALGELELAERGPAGEWRLTGRGAHLRAEHPLSLATAALEYAGPLRHCWEALPQALRSLEWRPPEVFAQVAADSARRGPFHRMLRSYALHDYAPWVPRLPVEGASVVVDAGGGTGALSSLVLAHHPHLQGVVLDLPEVVAEIPAGLHGGRLRAVGADLFAPWPLQAELILLARVLHDWDDERAVRLLIRAREALRPGGRLVLLELVLEEEQWGGSLCDLHLLVVTGGQERTREQFARLLEAAGLRLERVESAPTLPKMLVVTAA